MPPVRFAPPTEVPGLAARRIAADILDGVLHKRRTLDDQLEGAAAHPGLKTLSDRDRALMRRLVATILRRLGTLGHVLSRLLDRGIPTDAPRAQSALLIGAAQILWTCPITPRSTCRCGWYNRTGAPRNMPASSTRCCAAARARASR
jgi:16S rRNA (cytosine967-C5)-methyltransferase